MDTQLETIRENAERAGDLQKLIDELTKATGPSRALDIDICDIIHGKQRRWSGPTPEWARLYHARPTESIDAALSLVPAGYFGSVPFNRNCDAWVRASNDEPLIYGSGANPAIALCVAALKARESAQN